MIQILHGFMDVCMYYTTRIPTVLVYEVYIRACRSFIINGSLNPSSLDSMGSLQRGSRGLIGTGMISVLGCCQGI